MRPLLKYTALGGIAALSVGLGAVIYLQNSGMSLYHFVSKGVQRLDRDGSPAQPIARFTRRVLLDSGLLSDPIKSLPRDIVFELPQWQGTGASALRSDTAPRYTTDGRPIPSGEQALWLVRDPPVLQTVQVDSVQSLRHALDQATPGTQIELAPGRYRLQKALTLRTAGSADKPIVLRGKDVDSTVVELEDGASLVVNGSYWAVSDLIVRGRCTAGPCPHFLQVKQGATGLTARNLFVSGIQTLVKDAAGDAGALRGLIDGVTLIDGHITDGATDWPADSIRRISTVGSPGRTIILCPTPEDGPDCDTTRLSEALKKTPEGGLLLMRSGVYEQAAIINKPGIHLLAEPGAMLYRTATGGKGALVVRSDVTIEGLSCSHIKVADGNGCCVRQDMGDVTLIGVHFHHAQMGVLTGHRGGDIQVFDSYFHDSGYDGSGNLGHNIYVNSGSLEFVRSWSLAARNAGHEIKSRATRTLIQDSLIASLNARDSRLIDIPDGGLFELTGSVLGEGPRSENWDLIAYGLEAKPVKVGQRDNRVTIERNTFYIDRGHGGQLFNQKQVKELNFRDNVIVGDVSGPAGNVQFGSRAEAGTGDYPTLAPLTL